MLVSRKHGNDSVNGFSGVHGVQRGKHQVTGFRSGHANLAGFDVTHLADEDDVGVLAECCPQSLGKAASIEADFALVDDRALVAEGVFDGVFNRHDVTGFTLVDVVHHGRQRRRLARTGNASNQYESALVFSKLEDSIQKPQLSKVRDLRGDEAGAPFRLRLVVGTC